MCDQCFSSRRAIRSLPRHERAGARRAWIRQVVDRHGTAAFEDNHDVVEVDQTSELPAIVEREDGALITTTNHAEFTMQLRYARSLSSTSGVDAVTAAPVSSTALVTRTISTSRPAGRASRGARRPSRSGSSRASSGGQDSDPDPPRAPRALGTRALLRRIQARGTYEGYRLSCRDLETFLRDFAEQGLVELTAAGWRLTPSADSTIGRELRGDLWARREAA